MDDHPMPKRARKQLFQRLVFIPGKPNATTKSDDAVLVSDSDLDWGRYNGPPTQPPYPGSPCKLAQGFTIMTGNRSTLLLRISISLLTTLLLFSCNRFEIKSSYSQGSFKIVFLGSDLDQMNFPERLGHSFESSWKILSESYPGKAIYTLDDLAIQSYDWGNQVIVINPVAAKEFLDHFNCQARIDLSDCLYHQTFLVVFDGDPIYGGLFFPIKMTEEMVDFPVIYPKADGDRFVFQILPNSPALLYQEHNETVDADWGGIKNERIREYFDSIQKLIE